MIQIVKYEKFIKKKIVGYVDIRLDNFGIIIRRIAHLSTGEKRWFNFPAYSIPREQGGFDFIPYVQFESNGNNGDFFKRLGRLVDEYLKNEPDTENRAPQEISF